MVHKRPEGNGYLHNRCGLVRRANGPSAQTAALAQRSLPSLPARTSDRPRFVTRVCVRYTRLLIEIEREVSVIERHRVVKVWRAFWKKMGGMKHGGGKYCEQEADPAKSFRNSAPDARQESWQRREVLQRAWRMGYYGLAACMATAWDSMCSPVDVRTLTPSKVRSDAAGIWFAIDRA
jgi:hypothetical protein